MVKILIMGAVAIIWPFAFIGAQDFSPALLESLPGVGAEPKGESVVEALSRPEPQQIVSELSDLRLGSKQEERLLEAIDKKARDFDKLMKEYDKTSAEERKWRFKAEGQRQELVKINQSIPELIKEYLDEDQRQSYNAMLAAKSKPAPKAEAAIAEKLPVYEEIAAPKPVKKRRVLRKKRRPSPAPAAAIGAEAAGAIPAAPGAAPVAVPAEEESGVMVDKEQGAAPARKKRRVLRKKAAAPAESAAPKEDIMANEPEGAAEEQPPDTEEN